MEFDIKKIIKKSLLVSFMLGSSAFMFNNVYATTASTSSSSKITDAEAAVAKKFQANMTEQYKTWLEANPKASDSEKSAKQQELATKAYENLSDSDKKLVDSYLNKLESNNSSSSSSSSSKTKTKTSTSSKKAAASSAKTKTGDPCSISLLAFSLLGSLSSCILNRKKLV